jgi:hypothetical protein
VTTTAPHDADHVPAWVAYGGVLVVGGTALAVLAYYQHRLGLDARMPWLLSWTFSIGLDWGSAVGGVFWFFGGGQLARWGRWTAISLVLVSTALTCIAWGRLAGWEWAFLGLIHPAVAFLMAKLLTLWQAGRAEARAGHDDLAERLQSALADGARLQGALALASVAAAALAAPDAAQPAAGRAAAVVATPSAPPAAGQAYVHDQRRLPLGSAEWQARFDALPGAGKTEKALAWLHHEWDAGREPSGAAIDAVVDGNSTGRLAKKKLRDRGVLPPSEREQYRGSPALAAAS